MGDLATPITSEEAARLIELSETINRGLVLEEILDHVFVSFRSAIPYDRLGFALLEDGGRTVRSVWARSVDGTLRIPAGFSAPLEGSSLAAVIETGRPRILNDLEEYLAAHPASASTALIVAEGIRSSLTCPLVAFGRRVGFLFFSSRRPYEYADAHVAFFLRIAVQLSLVLEKGRLYRELLDEKAELEAANRRLSALATQDGLTGLGNRRAFDERLDLEWRRAARERTPLSLILADVDHFKSFNDTYGHPFGDDCLRSVADELREVFRRASDFVARYGGEEFAIILPNTDREGAVRAAEVARARVARLAPRIGEIAIAGRITLSLGVAAAAGIDSPDALVAAADMALFRAKREGKNRVAS